MVSCVSSWVSVLQNSKEEALNQAFKGNQNEGENNIIQELTRAIVGEVKRMSGNDSCCDCGAAGQGGRGWQLYCHQPAGGPLDVGFCVRQME